MTVKIDGTNTEANPAFTGADTDTGLQCGTDELKLVTGGTARATVDSSGRLLAGTTSSSGNFRAVFQGNSGNSAAGGDVVLARGAATPANLQALGLLGFSDSTHTASGLIQCKRDGGTWSGSSKPTLMAFQTCGDGSTTPTERMRITSNGDVYIGETSGGTSAGSIVKAKGYNTRTGHNGSFGVNSFNIWWAGSSLQAYVDFTNVGTFTLTSDYRVKKNIETIDSFCIERVKQLRPVRYELADYGDLYKADGIVREGFIAHEVQEVIPSGAEGKKDEENRIQNLRTDAIVAVLTKAFQEAISKIETLETQNTAQQTQIDDLLTRVTALEAAE